MDIALNKYLEEARAAEFMLKNELAVLESARTGEVKAKHTLVQAYLFRTAEIALRLAPEGMSKLNAIQEANIALVQLVARAPEPSIAYHLESAIKKHFGTLNTQAEQLV
jgi:DNA-directed RNA polymerase sigma subunit (sigma70/sigma32)